MQILDWFQGHAGINVWHDFYLIMMDAQVLEPVCVIFVED